MAEKSDNIQKRDEALRRAGLIAQFERFAAAAKADGIGRVQAQMIFAAKKKIRSRTLRRWIRDYRRRGLAGLVDGRGTEKGNGELVSPEAWDLFASMWLTEQRMSVKVCRQNLCYINDSEDRGWRIPPLRTMQRLAIEKIPLPVRVLHREGLAAYQAKCAPFVITEPDSVQPGQIWVGDHSQLNIWLRHRGRWVRPWLTAWMDMRSRLVTGWHVSGQPNQTTILLAMKRGVEKHGPPDAVHIDNGRDYDSEAWTGTTKVRRRAVKAGYVDEQLVAGIYAMMETAVIFAQPYHPQSKSIERLFDTIDRRFSNTFESYCGKDTNRKPERIEGMLKSRRALAGAMELADFIEAFGRYIEVYNNTVHTGNGMAGESPAQVFAGRSSRRVLKEGVIELLMRVWSGELTVGKNGVRFKELWFGQFDSQLMALQGRKVRCSYDPADLRQVQVYDAATWRFITMAEQAKFVAYGAAGEADLREAMKKKNAARRATKAYRNSQLIANMDLTDLTLAAMAENTQPQPELPGPVTLRPVRTPLDDQAAKVKRHAAMRAVRRAACLSRDGRQAGAEGTREVLDIDLASMCERTEDVDLGLFDAAG